MICGGLTIKKGMYFIMMKVIISESFGLMIVSSSLIRIVQQILRTKRINIDYAEEAKDYLWRFIVKDNPYISK